MYALWADFLLSLSGRQEGEKPRMHKRFSSLKIDTCSFLKTCDMLTVIIKTTGKEILLFQKCFLEYRYRANMYALQLYIYFCEPISSNRVDMYDSRTFFHLQYCKEQDRRTLVDLFYQDDQFLNSGNAFVQDSYSEKVTSGFDIGYVRCMPNYKDWNATGFRAQLKLKTGTSIVARWDFKSSVRRKLSPRKNKFVHAKQHLTY